MLQFKTLVMFVVVVLVTAGTYFGLSVSIDRSETETKETGVTADEVFGSSQPATLDVSTTVSTDLSPEEVAIRRIARATAKAAAAHTADEVARATVADQL